MSYGGRCPLESREGHEFTPATGAEQPDPLLAAEDTENPTPPQLARPWRISIILKVQDSDNARAFIK